MNGDTRIHRVRDELRRVGWCDHATLDAVAELLGDREINLLAGKLGMIAAHLASRAGIGQGMPPPGTFPGAGSERIDLAAQWNAVTVAGWFVRKKLTGEHRSESTTLGMVVTALSLAAMPLLGRAKHRLAVRLNSAATAGEGTQNYLCAIQAAAVLTSLALTAVWSGGWWLDSVVGLGVAGAAARQGVRSWRGDDCC